MASHVTPPKEEDHLCICGCPMSHHRRNMYSCYHCKTGDQRGGKWFGCNNYVQKTEDNEFVVYVVPPDTRGARWKKGKKRQPDGSWK
jgi:hypothetical protein